MSGDPWINTTHDWTASVDLEHVTSVRQHAERLAPSGVLHLVLEVLAYAADEAESTGGGMAEVTLLPNGSVRVADDGRGTDTRRRPDGTVVRKPVMATADLRFFDAEDAPALGDGHPRRGMSVVAALSDWLVHENRRADGRWRQRYEDGLPVSQLVELPPDGTTGTTVHFQPQPSMAAVPQNADAVLSAASTRWLKVEVDDDRR